MINKENTMSENNASVGDKRPLRLVLVHGTWSDGSRWTDRDTTFYQRLTRRLEDRGYDVSNPERVIWHSWNRSKAREKAKQALLEAFQRDSDSNQTTPMLIVAHSHGGNFSTSAFREAAWTPGPFPVRGIVCLNTPFLTQELRASTSFLKFWLLLAITLLLLPAIVESRYLARATSIERAIDLLLHPQSPLPDLFWPLNQISPSMMVAAFLAISATLLLMIALTRKYRSSQQIAFKRKPRVLCLSCCDDEAISLLGLGEGLANLTHLAFHPVALILYAIIGTAISYLSLEDMTLTSWVYVMRHFFIIWTLTALVLSTISSVWVSILFGHGPSDAVRSLVSRTLVSYVPLRPSKSEFRAVSDLVTPWWRPGLFHSSIYESEQTIDEIDLWLDDILPRRDASGSALETALPDV
ncbi:alpha/beta fold hydrolase [Luteimonas sp. MC1572]|nr:alpha/beta fold hydrolase [Luteimonas sp. MC1572]QQO04237.1 alpha/beta fold hydrolase [Luteimonas sp. MC1572]